MSDFDFAFCWLLNFFDMSDNEDTTLTKAQIGKTLKKLIKNQKDAHERVSKELTNAKREPQNRRTKYNYNFRLERAVETRQQFIATHKEIIQYDEADDTKYIKKDKFDEFEDMYLDVISQISNIRDSYFPSTDSNASPNLHNSTMISPLSSSSSNSIDSPYKLPTLNLPEFNGDYDNWLSFYDSFLLIHNHEKLTLHHKFQYLKSVLSPSVKSVGYLVIGYLDITAENYTETFEDLKLRYNHKRVLFGKFMDNLLS